MQRISSFVGILVWALGVNWNRPLPKWSYLSSAFRSFWFQCVQCRQRKGARGSLLSGRADWALQTCYLNNTNIVSIPPVSRFPCHPGQQACSPENTQARAVPPTSNSLGCVHGYSRRHWVFNSLAKSSRDAPKSMHLKAIDNPSHLSQ